MPFRRLPSTGRVLITALSVIFLIEFLLMIVGLPLFNSDSKVIGGLLDAGNLVLWSAPLLWWSVIRPFRRAAIAEAEKFGNLLEGAPSSVVCVNGAGAIVYINAQAEKMFGYTRAELLGKTVEILMPEQVSEHHVAERKSYLAAPRIADMSNSTGKRKDGHEFPVNVSLSYIQQPEGPLAVAIVLDMTEQKRNREQLELANTQLRESLQQREQRSREIALLIEMGELLQACKNQQEAEGVIGKYARRLFPEEYGAVCLLSASRDIVEPVVTWGSHPVAQQAFLPDDCWALRRGKPHLMSEAEPFPCEHLHSANGNSMCLPMVAQGETLGVFHLRSNPTASGSFSEPQQRLAMAVAGQIALTLASLRLRMSLWNQSVRDPLTALYNRRYMEESLERELRRAARHHSTVAIIILDLDHFKQFNDTFGHSAGDAALRSVGKLIATRVRREDIPCRYGGEEFVIIFPDMDLEIAQRRTEELRKLCHGLNLERYRDAGEPVTLSAGIAMFPTHGSSSEEVLHAADRALYQAKKEGRDRVLVAAAAVGAS
jgi:diguanylate cyclase (GGDEF)-like protein/PAS domain S-box-containing protein